jgi:hypothetical protein
VLETAARIPGYAKQEVLAYVPPLRLLADSRHKRRLRQFEPQLPVLPPEREAVLEGVRTRGASVTSLDALDFPGTDQMKAGAQALKDELAQRHSTNTSTVRPPREWVLARPAIWQWGLNEQVLDMVESYIGLPARYDGASVRCERATGEAFGVRQWHRDIEDRRMLKLLVWLNDVDDDGGPFEYVDRARTPDLTRSLRYISGYVSDEAIRRQVPESEWRRGTGPMWTSVIADPRNVFHRAMPPVRRDRYSLTFSYTSRSPVRTMSSPALSRQEREWATRGLNARQLACLPRAYTK